MKILWTNHPNDPTKNGKTEHVSHTLADIAIGYGQAEHVPYKSYIERLAEEGQPKVLHHGSVSVPFVKGVEYSVVLLPCTGTPIILRKHGTETDRIVSVEQAKAVGCPKTIVEQLATAIAAPQGGAAQALAEAKQRQVMQEENEKHLKWGVLFGSK
jgi:hypothetical protein